MQITIYKHYEIEIHDLPPLSQKNFNQSNPISYKDLPDKDVLGIALEISNSRTSPAIVLSEVFALFSSLPTEILIYIELYGLI